MATEANYVNTCPVNRVDHNMNKKQEAQVEKVRHFYLIQNLFKRQN